MALVCGPITTTISYVTQSICGHLVKISDIRPTFSTIDVQVDSQMIPGVGSVSVSLAPDYNYRANISLISKNSPGGTATVVFSIETIEAPPPPPPPSYTHELDVYVKPYSWYTPNGAADRITTMMGDVNGAILNVFTNLGVTDYQYVGTDVVTEADKPGYVTIRVKLNKVGGMGVMAAPLAAWIGAIIAAVVVIIIIIGVITGWKFTLAGIIEQITGKEYTKDDVVKMVWTNKDSVVNQQMTYCEKNFTDPILIANCKKSTMEGAADGLTDALGTTGTDSATLGINDKVDACTAQYNIDHDAVKYKACVDGVANAAGKEIEDKTPKAPKGLSDMLIWGALGLGALFIISRSPGYGRERVLPVYVQQPAMTRAGARAIARRGG